MLDEIQHNSEQRQCQHAWDYTGLDARCNRCGLTDSENPCTHRRVTSANFGAFTCNDCGRSFRERPIFVEHATDEGRCRFNCRTAKENWIEGFVAGILYEDARGSGKPDMQEQYNEAENEWKRQQPKTG